MKKYSKVFEWLGVFCIISGTFLTSENVYPYNTYFLMFGSVFFSLWSYLEKIKSVFYLNIVLLLVLL